MNNYKDEIQVSVCVVTYNQEVYIAECLESLVSQKTDFKFEIIVGEDGSTDNTRAVVQKYVDKFPNLIVPLFYEKNIGAVENIKRVYKKAQGKYIAHIDGDDMALPNKLQKQFDILELYPDCSICGHDVNHIDRNSKKIGLKRKKIFDTMNRIVFIERAISFCHSSKMFRNDFSDLDYDKLLNSNDIIDYEIHLESLKYGKFIHINEILGQYRVLTGMSSDAGKISSVLLNAPDRIFPRLLKDCANNNDYRIIKKRYSIALLRLSLQVALMEGDKSKFKKLVYKSIKINKISLEQLLFLIGTLSPNLFFFLLKIRSKIF